MTDRLLRFEDFGDKVGQTFTIAEEGFPAIPLTLAEAELLRTPQMPHGGRPAFSLIFVDSGKHMFPQRLYRVAHATLGTITLFLVPVGKDANGVNYQALFN